MVIVAWWSAVVYLQHHKQTQNFNRMSPRPTVGHAVDESHGSYMDMDKSLSSLLLCLWVGNLGYYGMVWVMLGLSPLLLDGRVIAKSQSLPGPQGNHLLGSWPSAVHPQFLTGYIRKRYNAGAHPCSQIQYKKEIDVRQASPDRGAMLRPIPALKILCRFLFFFQDSFIIIK